MKDMKNVNVIFSLIACIIFLHSCSTQDEIKKRITGVNELFQQDRSLQTESMPESFSEPHSVSGVNVIDGSLDRLFDFEKEDIERVLLAQEIQVEPIDQAVILLPDKFDLINLQLDRFYPNQTSTLLDPDVHEYAFVIPASNYRWQSNGMTIFPSMVIGFDIDFPLLPADSDEDDVEEAINPDTTRERHAALLEYLLPLLAMPVGDMPNQAPPKQPACPPPVVPDTDATISNAKGRITRSKIHTNNQVGSQKQGDWARIRSITQDGHRTNFKGLTLLFYKILVSEGCDRTGKWHVGLSNLDVQFRILVDKDAQQLRPAADGGTTPGGIQGTLGHEAEHGEAVGWMISEMLRFKQSPGIKFKKVIDEMKRKSYASKLQAQKAAKKYQARLEAVMKLALRAGATHSPKGTNRNATVFPRNDEAERIDDANQRKLTDRKVYDDLKKDMNDLVSKHEYKPYHKPGMHGVLAKSKKKKK